MRFSVERRVLSFSLFLSLFFGIALAGTAEAQHKSYGRGATSAQDLAQQAKASAMAATSGAAPGSDPADQVCARFAAGSAITAPPELKSQNGVLELTFKFLTATDAQGLPRYCFITDSGLQAPTLRVNAGDKLIIHFQNDLPAAAGSDAMAGMKMALNDSSDPCNGAMSATASNIHFHGTNVAPLCGQDEVVHTLVAPGQTFDYNVQIPANEPPGLYWYHPHPHGFSEGQVQGGATGALIVEGLQNVDPALAGLPERTFVLRDQLLPASEGDDANIPAWDLSINYIPVTFPSYTPAIIPTNPARKELWRVANTAADSILNLQYIINGTAQSVEVVAIDGYPVAAGSTGQLSETETSLLLPPGARVEFVVTTPNVGDKAQLITQYWNTGPDGDFDPTRTIATIVSQTGAEGSAGSGGAVVGRLPAKVVPKTVTRFHALAAATPVAQRNLYFSEVLQDPSDPNSPTNFFITEEGQQPSLFTMGQKPNIVVHSGTVEDWVVENRAQEDHIFHIHQIHFQVLEVDGQAVNDPAVHDTFDVPYWSGTGPYHSVKLRMDFRDPNVIGTFVYHCHILQHEDAGMMAEIEVLPSGQASSATATASASSVLPNGSITLTASVSSATAGGPTPTGLVQFLLDGANVGNPTALVNGKATLTTPINGNAGTDTLTAFYQGDASYTESVSAGVPMTVSAFALSSAGATAPLGAAAIASIQVNAATGFTMPIALSCAMPASLTEAACFVNPNSTIGTGPVSLTVNSTPSHPLSSAAKHGPGWIFASGGASLACVFLLALPRRGLRRGARGSAMVLLACLASGFALMGCGSSSKIDPGTAKGTYTVVVTGTAGSGTGQVTTSINVPVTIQ